MAASVRRGFLVLPRDFRRLFIQKVVVPSSGIQCASCQRQQHRLLYNFSSRKVKVETADLVAVEDVPRDHFVPITRRSVIRHLMQEKDFLTEDEMSKFERLGLSLDSAIINKYHGILQELKSLFDPINPDKDTIQTREWNKRERLDNEFWLIQKLSSVLQKANFRELPRATVEKAMAEHQSREGVLVSVDTELYDVLRFWALGRETPPQTTTLLDRFNQLVLRKPPPPPLEYYKRIVVAVRLKKDDKLILKAFKEVPVNALEQLLPDGKIKMTQLDKSILATTVTVALGGVLAKVVTYLAHVQVDWTLILTMVTGLVGFQSWSVYKNRRNAYLVDLNRMLYFKNIANNRGLLALLVDRAEDELFKEAMLIYSFLLTNRAPSVRDKDSGEQLPEELGSMSQDLLELKVQDWVHHKTGSRIQFSADEAIHVLSDLGLLSSDYENILHVLSVDAALRNLPLTPQTMSTRKEEYDIVEGYDRDISRETDEEYKAEEKKRKKFGWF